MGLGLFGVRCWDLAWLSVRTLQLRLGTYRASGKIFQAWANCGLGVGFRVLGCCQGLSGLQL